MARFNFNLRNPSSNFATSIHLIVRWSKNRVVINTKESIHPKFWEGDKSKSNFQRAKTSKRFPEYPEFNTRLDNIIVTAKDIFRKYINDHDFEQPSVEIYRRLLTAALSGNKSEIKIELFEFINKFINEALIRNSSKKNSIVITYKQTFRLIEEYSNHKRRNLDFDNIDLDFYHDFIDYMETEKNYSVNNIGKHIKTLKTFLNDATERGFNTCLSYKSKRFKVLQENVDSIYLTEDELDKIFNLDLSKQRKLEKARDLFIVGCWTGLRFSDFTNIAPNNIKGNFIEIETQKTGEIVVIPIHEALVQIMRKYKNQYPNSLPPSLSNVKMNKYLKEIGALIESLQAKTSFSITRGGKKRTVTIKKFERITTHTARRSFATNLFLSGVPSLTIMKITGHRTEQAFLKYIKITPDENAKILQLHWQKQYKLRAF